MQKVKAYRWPRASAVKSSMPSELQRHSETGQGWNDGREVVHSSGLRMVKLGLLRRKKCTDAGALHTTLAGLRWLLLLIVGTLFMVAALGRSRSGGSGIVATHAFVRIMPTTAQKSMGHKADRHQVGQKCMHRLPKVSFHLSAMPSSELAETSAIPLRFGPLPQLGSVAGR